MRIMVIFIHDISISSISTEIDFLCWYQYTIIPLIEQAFCSADLYFFRI